MGSSISASIALPGAVECSGNDTPTPEETAQLLDKEIPESIDFIKSAVTRIDEFINAVMRLARQGASQPASGNRRRIAVSVGSTSIASSPLT